MENGNIGRTADAKTSTGRRKLSPSSHRPSEQFANFGFSTLNQNNNLKLNTSGAKWTASENIGSPESENGPRCYVELDRFQEKSPDILGI